MDINEKKDERSRSWLVTLPADGEFSYSREDVEEALDWCTAYAGQKEQGSETGYLHWQILIEHVEPVRFSTLRKRLAHGHIEPRRGSIQQALAYVLKTDTRVDSEEPLRKGEIKDERGKRTDLEELRKVILESSLSLNQLVIEYPEAASYATMCRTLIEARDADRWGNRLREVCVNVLFGPTGVGKTRKIFEDRDYSGVCRVTHYGSGAFDAYGGEETLALDEFRGQIPIETLLTILDCYPVKLPAQYSDKMAAYNKVFIVSNVAPWEWYPYAPAEQKKALARRFDRVLRVDGAEAQDIEEIERSTLIRLMLEKVPHVGI